MNNGLAGNSYKILLIWILVIPATMQLFAQKNERENLEADSIVDFALKYIGKPYKWAGNSDKGFDCSGFVSFVYGHFDMKTPRSACDYKLIGTEITIENYHKGDIILFSGTDYNKSIIGHVGIIISENGEPLKFIHSSSSKKHWGVVITDYTNSNYPKRYIGIRRVLNNTNK